MIAASLMICPCFMPLEDCSRVASTQVAETIKELALEARVRLDTSYLGCRALSLKAALGMDMKPPS
jgi:hypothetical protein